MLHGVCKFYPFEYHQAFTMNRRYLYDNALI